MARRGGRARRLAGAALALAACAEPAAAPWDAAQIALLRSLSLAALPPPPLDPSNRVSGDERAARLGRRLFFDAGLSANGEVSCATCHAPELHFTDGRAVSRGIADGERNAPSVVGAAFAPWQFWDGRRDSLWAQALAPLEVAAEMGTTRLEVVRHVTRDPRHRADYAALFGPPPDFAGPGFPPRASPFGDPEARAAWQRLPAEAREQVDRAFANTGKAIAAYERLLAPGPSRFDVYVDRLAAGDFAGAETVLGADEVAGLALFVDAGRTLCLRCHNGPLLTNQSFHDVASSRLGPIPDLGRYVGLQSLLLDPFNCLGPHSDAPADGCAELRFLERRETERLTGAFKTPTLREVARTAPYFHDGRLATLEAVIEHYRRPPADPGSEITPLELSDAEAGQLAAFLRTLSGGIAAPAEWLTPPPADRQ